MENKKIKLYLIPSGTSGIYYHRFFTPHNHLFRNNKEDISFDIHNAKLPLSMDELKTYDIIYVHAYAMLNKLDMFDKLVAETNVKIIVDIDDFWEAPKYHNFHELFRNINIKEKLNKLFGYASAITTSTEYLKGKLEKMTDKEIVVLPNCIDPEDNQFKPKEQFNDFTVGWVTAANHSGDLALMHGFFEKVNLNEKNIKLLLGGFTNESFVTTRDISGEFIKQTVENRTFKSYEKIFTSSYRNFTEKDLEILSKNDKEIETGHEFGGNYSRAWYEPIAKYGNIYTRLDIAVAPLVKNEFNKSKSALKAIEAGAHKKVFIGSDIEPYNDLIIDYREDKDNGNGFLIKETNKKEWFTVVDSLTKDRELVDLLGNRLYNDVYNKFNINQVGEARLNLYKKVINTQAK